MSQSDIEENTKNPIFVSFGPTRAVITRIRPFFAMSELIVLDVVSPPAIGMNKTKNKIVVETIFFPKHFLQ